MIRYTISPSGTRVITEICDTCRCHVQDLTIADVVTVRKANKAGLVIKDKTTGNVITRTEPRSSCYCDKCS